tara:strand:+ start:22 stop:159 length:138 start_codon:yes stop_codon:yes gene_type:complete
MDDKNDQIANNIEAMSDAIAEMNSNFQDLLGSVNELLEVVSEALT